jgi:hypothetical protein
MTAGVDHGGMLSICSHDGQAITRHWSQASPGAKHAGCAERRKNGCCERADATNSFFGMRRIKAGLLLGAAEDCASVAAGNHVAITEHHHMTQRLAGH